METENVKIKQEKKDETKTERSEEMVNRER